jgi:hypothetical protein
MKILILFILLGMLIVVYIASLKKMTIPIAARGKSVEKGREIERAF